MNGEDKTQALATRTYSADDAHELGLPSPEALNLLDSFAKKMQGSIFLPKALAGHPANILGVVLMGRELSFQPMQSLRMFWVSPDGRIAMYADAMMAAMRSKGFKFPEKEFTKDRAYLKTVRPDGEDFEAEFTMEDAKTAGLANKDNYRHYPKQMLRARVIAETYRFLAADLGGSQIYAREEIEDVEDARGGGSMEMTAELPVGPSPVGVKPEPPAETKPVVTEATPAPTEKKEPPTETTKAPPPTFQERSQAIAKKIGGKEEVALNFLARYFRGFLDVKRLAKDVALYTVPLDKLEPVLDQRMKDLMANPEELGAELAGRPVQKKGAAITAMEKLGWPEDVQVLAVDLMKQLEHTDQDFTTWLANIPALQTMGHDDLRIFLPLFGAVRGSALDLVDWAETQKKTLGEALAECKVPEQGTVEDVKQAIAAVVGDTGVLGF